MAELESSAAAAPWKKAPDDPDLSVRVDHLEEHAAQLDLTHQKKVEPERTDSGCGGHVHIFDFGTLTTLIPSQLADLRVIMGKIKEIKAEIALITENKEHSSTKMSEDITTQTAKKESLLTTEIPEAEKELEEKKAKDEAQTEKVANMTQECQDKTTMKSEKEVRCHLVSIV